ncbi:hypothetical protein MVEG_12435 [Podila verticillata NRRL 6337]|uniref:Secreted protein n=1 Tax=Podila verticillata NRRL 6337 TaxID=1069443 RepID=A0A086TIF0_9FUNG|nr:hypothetical protein MVEG_12435 [Podila verticillata NRRL 6337]
MALLVVVVLVGLGQANGPFHVSSDGPHLPFPLHVSSQSPSTEQHAPVGPLPHQPGMQLPPPVGMGPRVVVADDPLPTHLPTGHLPELQSELTLQHAPSLRVMDPLGHAI